MTAHSRQCVAAVRAVLAPFPREWTDAVSMAALCGARGEALAHGVADLHVPGSDDAAVHRMREGILQSALILGFPAVIDGLTAFRHALSPQDRKLASKEVPMDRKSIDSWIKRGEERFSLVYGDATAVTRAALRRASVSLDFLAVTAGYGGILAGNDADLSPARRELCLIAALASIDAPLQLESHVRAGLCMVADETTDVDAALIVAAATKAGAICRGYRVRHELAQLESEHKPAP